MTLAGLVRQASSLSVEPGLVRRAGAAEALLASFLSMQEATDLRTLAECAAAGLSRLMDDAAAAVYLETAEGETVFATAGQFPLERKERRLHALTRLATLGEHEAGELAGEPGTLAVSFQSDPVRGAVFVEGPAALSGDAEARLLVNFGRLAGVTAASVLRGARFRRSPIVNLVETALSPVRTVQASPTLRGAHKSAAGSGFSGLIGITPAIARIREVSLVAAQSSSGVLIEGESGTGKEVLSQAIHAAGPRSGQPFVAVLCAAIPRELLESELFGYEAGSFTGASPKGRAGKFEMAQGGTLLLDDVVDMPLDMQAKLLRVLQERVVTRLGASRPRPIDVRIIATSNRTISEAVRAGLFRADLYYRLNVLSIPLPPLRERPEDLKTLAEHFLRKHSPAHGSALRTIGPAALRALQSYSWPGNVRELEHCIESEIHFASPKEVCLDQLNRQFAAVATQRSAGTVRTLRELERELYTGAIEDAEGDVSRAARELGISRGKLYRKLRLYELLPRDL